jgi:rSAM/selenodomain-associated transferase 1
MGKPALLVIAKEPLPGRAKTRLCPPCTPAQAARLAAASLSDTLKAVANTDASRKVLVFDGDATSWTPTGFELAEQRGMGLADRLAAAFEDAGGAALLVGMDTPQLTAELLSRGLAALARADAVIGPALDGGYWCIGLQRPDRRVFDEIPMSEPTTYRAQRARLKLLGLTVAELPPLRDIDTIDDARAVAIQAPHTAFAKALAA